MRKWIAAARSQGGAVAVAAAVSAAVLVGFLGVVVDAGRLYVVKTELQNASDACALAAAFELDGNANALTRAENAGIAVATRNTLHFQSGPVSATASDIKFSTTLSGAGGDNSVYITQAAGAPAESRFVMCTLELPSLGMSLSTIIGAKATAVAGQAVATLAPAQTSCAIPLGVCQKGGSPGYGFTAGEWVSGRFDAGGGSTGSFNWIDFSPPSGGQSELAALLSGQGQCNTATGMPIGQSGIMGNAAGRAWNSRFGLYQGGGGNPQPSTSPPDFTGYSYTPTSWPTQANALPDFLNPNRVSNSPYQGNASTGLGVSNAYNASSTADHATYGASRRLAVAPVIDCAGWASSQTVPLQGYVCVLLLHPIGSPGDDVYMEYVGSASDPASPCSTSGLAGGTTGPLIPVLVQ
jgi:hypothetical protein